MRRCRKSLRPTWTADAIGASPNPRHGPVLRLLQPERPPGPAPVRRGRLASFPHPWRQPAASNSIARLGEIAKVMTDRVDGVKHGSHAAYKKYGCRCTKCSTCMSAYRKALMQKRRQTPIPSDKHGTATGYHYGCRCSRCSEARRDYMREQKAKLRLKPATACESTSQSLTTTQRCPAPTVRASPHQRPCTHQPHQRLLSVQTDRGVYFDHGHQVAGAA